MLTRRSFLEKAAAAGALAFAPGCSSTDPVADPGSAGTAATAQPNPSPDAPPPVAPSGDSKQPPVDPPPTEACLESEDNPLGPYYSANAPVKTSLRESGMAGTPLVVEGFVLGLGSTGKTCSALTGAEVDVWHADDAGDYDNVGFTLRGVFVSDANGKYRMETILPGRYLDGAEYRPRHIHVRVRAPGRTELITQLYFEGDPYNATDGMFKQALTMKPKDDGKGGLTAAFHFVLS
jgi:protocatechuate 3,4-dioxygenase beta subunit